MESQSLSVSSNCTGKCRTVYILMLLSRQGARKNWNQVKLINTNVSAKQRDSMKIDNCLMAFCIFRSFGKFVLLKLEII